MKLYEETLGTRRIFDGRIIGVREDKIRLENGKESVREVVEHSGGVCVAALDDEDNLLFVRQFRYAPSQVLLEVPAGKLEPGEDPGECGRRELEEETGYVCDTYRRLATIYPTPAYVTEVIHMYYAAGLHKASQKLDEGEFLTVERIPLDKAVEMVLNDEIPDAKTQIAVMKLKLLREMGKL